MKMSKVYMWLSCSVGVVSILLYAAALLWLWELNLTFFTIGLLFVTGKTMMVLSDWALDAAEEEHLKERNR